MRGRKKRITREKSLIKTKKNKKYTKKNKHTSFSFLSYLLWQNLRGEMASPTSNLSKPESSVQLSYRGS
jgi:hypothetical protein